MQAALPHVDDFVDGHSLAALEQLARSCWSGGGGAVHDVVDEVAPAATTAGDRFALATVVGTWRSAPRQPGAAMVVAADGEPIGSVSGGCVEGAVYELAQEVMASGEPVLQRYGVSDDDAFAVGLTCGGIIDIFVEPVDASAFPELPDVVGVGARARAGRGGDGGRRAGQRRRAPGRSGRTAAAGGLGLASGSTRRSPTTSAACSTTAPPGCCRIGPDGERRQDELSVFVQSFAPPPRMLVFGAIDFAAAVARVGKFLGYRVTVCDARPVFATAQALPGGRRGRRRVAAPLPESTPQVDARTVICVLTHDPKFDVPLLEVALRTDAAYIGAMGSRRTHDDRLARLREEGVTEEALARLASPIGLDIGARTPEETAVSIAAEIVAHRWGGPARRLTATDGPIHTDPHPPSPPPSR